MDGRPPQKSRSVTVAFVTLQRDPPLTRILAPGFRAPSRSTIDGARLKRRAKMAVARPAAPAPTTATSHDRGSSNARARSLPLSGALPIFGRLGHFVSRPICSLWTPGRTNGQNRLSGFVVFAPGLRCNQRVRRADIHRLREIESLHRLAAEGLELGELVDRFHAFGHDVDSEIAGERHDRTDHFQTVVPGADSTDERPIHLHGVRLQPMEVAQ